MPATEKRIRELENRVFGKITKMHAPMFYGMSLYDITTEHTDDSVEGKLERLSKQVEDLGDKYEKFDKLLKHLGLEYFEESVKTVNGQNTRVINKDGFRKSKKVKK
jgi:hypothetical protein